MAPTKDTKRKRVTVVDEKSEPTIAKAWESMKKRGPIICKSKDEFITAVEDRGSVIEIMAAAYFKSADMENRMVVPIEFQDFSIMRGEKSEVVSITDSQGSRLEGAMLKKMMAYSALREKGFKIILTGECTDAASEMLAIPSLVMITDETIVGAKDERLVQTLFTPRSSTTIHVKPELVADVLKLDYVTMDEFANVLRALNSLAGKEDLADFDAAKLKSPADIQALLGDETAKQYRKQFLQTLFAARIRQLTPSERTSWFKGNPSYTLANQLKLRLPHSGPCFAKLQNKLIPKKLLGDLEAGDSVLMSTNPMSQKDYNSIKGNVANFEVYVDTPDLGGRRGGKWAEMNVKFLEPAGSVMEVLSAISSANEQEESAPSAKPPSAPTGTGQKVVELD